MFVLVSKYRELEKQNKKLQKQIAQAEQKHASLEQENNRIKARLTSLHGQEQLVYQKNLLNCVIKSMEKIETIRNTALSSLDRIKQQP